MKKTFFLAVLIFASLAAKAQTGKVGVNTTNPTEVLDVNGTERVRNLPLHGTANAIHTKPDGTLSPNRDQTFTATKTVVADNNGVLGIVNGLPSSSLGKASDFKTFAETSPDTTDAIILQVGCLRLMLDPSVYASTHVISLYGQVLPSCTSNTTSRAIAVETGGDSGNPAQQHRRREDLNVSTSNNLADFTYFSSFYQTMSAGPVFMGTIVLSDLQQVYGFTYSGEYNSTTSLYEISLALNEIH